MIHANSGMNLVNVDTHSIAQGSYWLVINTGGSKQTYQFVKQ